jgi:hypothetical protein
MSRCQCVAKLSRGTSGVPKTALLRARRRISLGPNESVGAGSARVARKDGHGGTETRRHGDTETRETRRDRRSPAARLLPVGRSVGCANRGIPRASGAISLLSILTQPLPRLRASVSPCPCYQTPTWPRTESISFPGLKPTPCLKTVSTLRISLMFADGSPSRTTRSACLPFAIEPIRASRPR